MRQILSQESCPRRIWSPQGRSITKARARRLIWFDIDWFCLFSCFLCCQFHPGSNPLPNLLNIPVCLQFFPSHFSFVMVSCVRCNLKSISWLCDSDFHMLPTWCGWKVDKFNAFATVFPLLSPPEGTMNLEPSCTSPTRQFQTFVFCTWEFARVLSLVPSILEVTTTTTGTPTPPTTTTGTPTPTPTTTATTTTTPTPTAATAATTLRAMAVAIERAKATKEKQVGFHGKATCRDRVPLGRKRASHHVVPSAPQWCC